MYALRRLTPIDILMTALSATVELVGVLWAVRRYWFGRR